MLHHLHNPDTHHSQTRVVAVAMTVVVIFLMVTNIILSAEMSHLGIRLTVTEQKAQALAQSAEKIRQELAVSNSLTDLEIQAHELGYTRDVHYVTLPRTSTVAYKP
jgi:hypothetical protein